MDSFFKSSAPEPTAPPLSASGFSSYANIPSTANAFKKLLPNNEESSKKLKITSWVLFVVSIIFSIIFA